MITLYEEKILYHCTYSHYYNFIRRNCNPLVKTYKIMINDVTLQKSKVGEYNANYSIKQKFLQGFNAATALTHNVIIFTWL